MKIFDIFLIFAQNIDCAYTLEPPQRGGSNEYPQSMFWSKNKKNMYRVSKKNDASFNRYLFLYFNLNWYAFNIYYTGYQYPLRISN